MAQRESASAQTNKLARTLVRLGPLGLGTERSRCFCWLWTTGLRVTVL